MILLALFILLRSQNITKSMVKFTSGLKDKIILSDDGESSDTLYIRGVVREVSEEALVDLLLHLHQPITSKPEDDDDVEIDLSEHNTRNVVWMKCVSEEVALERLQALHQAEVRGKTLSVKFELGRDPISGKVRIPGSTHNTIIRRLQISHSTKDYAGNVTMLGKRTLPIPTTGTAAKQSADVDEYCAPCNTSSIKHPSKKANIMTVSKVPTYNYSHKSILFHVTHPLPTSSSNVMTMELPFPSGLYFTRLIALTKSLPVTDPLLQLLLNHSNHITASKYPKEISEAFAMVDALQRALKLHHISYQTEAGSKKNNKEFDRIVVYVLGDGKIPLCAAALCLHFPSHFSFHSIDPILIPLESIATSSYADRFHQHRMLSQNFDIAAHSKTKRDEEKILSVVVACHSHAPLHEFWDRLSSPKIAVTMPCCADYSNIQFTLPNDDSYHKEVNLTQKMLSFEDFEVYSAKRMIHIYSIM